MRVRFWAGEKWKLRLCLEGEILSLNLYDVLTPTCSYFTFHRQDLQPPAADFTSHLKHMSLFSHFSLFGQKTEEDFAMHEWAAKQKEKQKKKNTNPENSSGKFSPGWERSERQRFSDPPDWIVCLHVHFGFGFCLQHVHQQHAMLPDFTFKWHDISHFWMDSEFKWNCSNCSRSLAQKNNR